MPILGQVETDAVERRRRFKPLTLFPLVALVFYDVSGGPFGIEVCTCILFGGMTSLAHSHRILCLCAWCIRLSVRVCVSSLASSEHVCDTEYMCV